ncbi:GEMIN5 [Mytilus edulis]|uniref:GEMIN5 n=1 Tax=Mytilus edulis TaxID=6550 RepID=A0A8S3QRL1_MYTED|nr:GEMIN5 [Mytilus edulis]
MLSIYLNFSGQYHRENDNMDYFYQLEIWKGNITGALRIAREREELSDWLVAMAPMASFESWVTVCTDYAIQLELEGQYHKAVSYLLAAHKVYDAIDLFKKHRLFKEAIALAKVRLSPFDPVLEDLYTLWAHQLTKDGNYEQAAKCHLAMRQVQDAANLLARRYNQPSLRTASHVCMIAKDKQQGLVYAQKVVQQYLIQNQWKEAYSFLKEDKHLQGSRPFNKGLIGLQRGRVAPGYKFQHYNTPWNKVPVSQLSTSLDPEENHVPAVEMNVEPPNAILDESPCTSSTSPADNDRKQTRSQLLVPSADLKTEEEWCSTSGMRFMRP